MSRLLFIPSVFYFSVTYLNGVLCVVEMDSAKQRIRAAAARQKEERKNKEAAGEASSTPKVVAKATKRKPDGDDSRPLKKAAVTPRDEPLKEKSLPKPSHGAGKGVMTSAGPVSEGPCRLLTHKDYAVGEVGSLIKPTDIEPCDQVGTEELGASALFDLTRVCLLKFCLGKLCFALVYFSTDGCVFLGLGSCQGPSRSLCGEGGGRHSSPQSQ